MGATIGYFAVRRAVQIDASPLTVWHEFQDIRRINNWFGRGQTVEVYEPGRNGRVELSVELDAGVEGFGGPIVVFEEGRELTFENNWFGDNAWPVPTFITLRLSACYDGTLVELFHHGFERLGKAGAEQYLGYEKGWDMRQLSALKDIVEK